MSNSHVKMQGGDVLPLGDDEAAEFEAFQIAGFISSKANAIATVGQIANARVANAMPDIDLANAIRIHQTSLVALISSKLKPNTLAAIDIAAGWPE